MPKSDQMPKKDQVPEKQQEPKGMQAHREGLDILHEISTLLVRFLDSSKQGVYWPWLQNVPLTYSQLAVCTSLIEEGVNPEALVVCIGL